MERVLVNIFWVDFTHLEPLCNTKNHVVLKRIETRRIASRFGRTRIYASRQDGVAPTLLLLQPIILKTVGTVGGGDRGHNKGISSQDTQGDLTQIFPTFSNPILNLNFYINADLDSI